MPRKKPQPIAFPTWKDSLLSLPAIAAIGGAVYADAVQRERGPFSNARNGGELVEVPSAFLKKRMPQLYKWLLDLFRYDEAIDMRIVLRDHSKNEGDSVTSISFSLWTKDDEFSISAKAPSGKMVPKYAHRRRGWSARTPHKSKLTPDVGYLGAGMTSRKPNVGEQHRRGNDLTDGDYSEETWREILKDILLNSILRIESKIERFSHRRRSRKRRTTKARVTARPHWRAMPIRKAGVKRS